MSTSAVTVTGREHVLELGPGSGYLDARGNRWHDLVRFRSQRSGA